MKKRELVIFNFSDCYKRQDFYTSFNYIWEEFDHLQGTNCYLDDEAKTILRERISKLPQNCLHFIDSGNYHYMSCLWLEQIKIPFVLLMLDNHTDLQPPAFGGLLSCGGWLREALETNPYLQKVWLAGPPQHDFDRDCEGLREKINHLPLEKIQEMDSLENFLDTIPENLPLYISLDKDVLSEEIPCNWDQGKLDPVRLLSCLRKIQKKRNPVLGIDVCGEADPGTEQNLHDCNNRYNRELLDILL